MSSVLAFSFLAGLLLWPPPQQPAAALDLPDEPAITPTLEMDAKITIEDPKGNEQQNEEAGVSRDFDVKEEHAEVFPSLPTLVLRKEEWEALRAALHGQEHTNSDAEGEQITAGFYGGEVIAK